MKAKKIILLVLIIAIAFLFLSVSSFAHARTKGGYTGKPGMPPSSFNQEYFSFGKHFAFPEREIRPWGMADLNLSQEQMAKIYQIRLEFQKTSLELKKDMAMKRLEIRELMMKDPVDMEKIRAKWEEIAQIQVELRMKAMEYQLKIKEVLTPEQLEKYFMGFSNFKYHRDMVGSNRGWKGSWK